MQCVGFKAIVGASSGLGAWVVGSDALYRPIDLRDPVPSGEYMYNNSGLVYSFNIPLKDVFSSAGSYANLKKLDQAFSGTSKYVFYNRTQHTAVMAGMGARMLGYDTVGLSSGLPKWNGSVANEKFMGSTIGTLMAVSASTTNIYEGRITPSYPAGSGLNLAPTINAGPTVTPSCNVAKATIAWGTDYPATSQVLYSTVSGGPYTKVNDTVLNTSHSVLLTLPVGTYYYKAVSYDCVANKVESSVNTFIFADVNVMPTTLNLGSKGDYVTAVIKLPAGYDCTMVDISTVKLQGTLPVVAVSGSCSTVDDRATVKFNRAAVAGIVSPGSNIMVVTGSTFGGTPIVGSSIMNAIH